MLGDSQNSSERILNLKKENSNAETGASCIPTGSATKRMRLDDTRFQCIVCQSNKISLSELHWHQTYQHSTEELSLSVIGLKGLVKIVSPSKKSSSQNKMEKENSEQRSIWSSFSKKPSQFYYLSSSILRVNGEQGDNTETPIDFTVTLDKDSSDIEVLNGLHNEVIEHQVEEVELEAEELEEEIIEQKEARDGIEREREIFEQAREKEFEQIEEREVFEPEEEREELEQVKNIEQPIQVEEREVFEPEEEDIRELEQENEREDEEDEQDEEEIELRFDEVEEEEVLEEVEEKADEVEERNNKLQVSIIPKCCSVPLVRVERYIDIPIVPKEEFNSVESEEEEELRGFEKSSIDLSVYDRFIDMRVIKKDLCWTRDISMEDFVRSVDGLCQELEDIKRLSVLKKSLRRRNIL